MAVAHKAHRLGQMSECRLAASFGHLSPRNRPISADRTMQQGDPGVILKGDLYFCRAFNLDEFQIGAGYCGAGLELGLVG